MTEPNAREIRLELYRSEHFVVDKRSGDVVIVMRRTATRVTPRDAVDEIDRINHALEGIDRAKHALLFDIRAAQLNGDPEFERAAQQFRQEVFRGFAAVSVLTSTAAGRLQTQRHAREEGFGATSDEEQQAVARLREQLAQARAKRAGA